MLLLLLLLLCCRLYTVDWQRRPYTQRQQRRREKYFLDSGPAEAARKEFFRSGRRRADIKLFLTPNFMLFLAGRCLGSFSRGQLLRSVFLAGSC